MTEHQSCGDGRGTGFTPGPWRRDGRTIEAYTDGKPGIVIRETVAEINRLGDPWPQSETWLRREANARLIAAAPTMAAYIRKRADEGDPEALEIWETACGRS